MMTLHVNLQFLFFSSWSFPANKRYIIFISFSIPISFYRHNLWYRRNHAGETQSWLDPVKIVVKSSLSLQPLYFCDTIHVTISIIITVTQIKVNHPHPSSWLRRNRVWMKSFFVQIQVITKAVIIITRILIMRVTQAVKLYIEEVVTPAIDQVMKRNRLRKDLFLPKDNTTHGLKWDLHIFAISQRDREQCMEIHRVSSRLLILWFQDWIPCLQWWCLQDMVFQLSDQLHLQTQLGPQILMELPTSFLLIQKPRFHKESQPLLHFLPLDSLTTLIPRMSSWESLPLTLTSIQESSSPSVSYASTWCIGSFTCISGQLIMYVIFVSAASFPCISFFHAWQLLSSLLAFHVLFPLLSFCCSKELSRDSFIMGSFVEIMTILVSTVVRGEVCESCCFVYCYGMFVASN